MDKTPLMVLHALWTLLPILDNVTLVLENIISFGDFSPFMGNVTSFTNYVTLFMDDITSLWKACYKWATCFMHHVT